MQFHERVCPRCGNPLAFGPDDDGTQKVCTPLSCDAWTITHRLTKQGKKPLRRDGRADLRLSVYGVPGKRQT